MGGISYFAHNYLLANTSLKTIVKKIYSECKLFVLIAFYYVHSGRNLLLFLAVQAYILETGQAKSQTSLSWFSFSK